MDYIKYNKCSTFAFCIGQITVPVPKIKDKYELKLPDPFSWKIYDNSKKKLPNILFSQLPFDFYSLIDMLPYKKNTLEETIVDDNCFNHDDYLLSNYVMFDNDQLCKGIHNIPYCNLQNKMNKEGSTLRCNTFVSNQRKHITNKKNIEYVTYVIFIAGTEGNNKYLTNSKYNSITWKNNGYNVNKITEIKPIKGSRLVVKNIHYFGAWIKYVHFI